MKRLVGEIGGLSLQEIWSMSNLSLFPDWVTVRLQEPTSHISTGLLSEGYK